MARILGILVLLLSLAFAAAPVFVDPFSGFDNGQVPFPMERPPVQPAGWAFSIWGLIYAWLVASAVFGLLRRAGDEDWTRARLPLALSLAVGVPWLSIALASAIWATVGILWMLAFAVAALLRAPARDRWWCRVPIAIYAGWLTAAAWVSLGSLGTGYRALLSPEGWAYFCIAGALVTGWAVQARRPDEPAYGLTLIWALVALLAASLPAEPGVAIAAAAGVALIGLLLATRTRRGLA